MFCLLALRHHFLPIMHCLALDCFLKNFFSLSIQRKEAEVLFDDSRLGLPLQRDLAPTASLVPKKKLT